jgi:hypothetical protein
MMKNRIYEVVKSKYPAARTLGCVEPEGGTALLLASAFGLAAVDARVVGVCRPGSHVWQRMSTPAIPHTHAHAHTDVARGRR